MRVLRDGLAVCVAMILTACGSESAQHTASEGAVPSSFGECQTCHSTQPGINGIGPSLAGVFGRQAAQEPSFAYSQAMRKSGRQSGLTWDAETLDIYLRDPQATVPGTKMSYNGLRDDAARAELIAWLKGA